MISETIQDSLTTLPTLYEVSIFIVIVFLCILMFCLYHYSTIQILVRQKSRCYKNKQKLQLVGKYVVDAVDQNGKKYYSVAYDFNSRSYNITCDNSGNIPNSFKVPVYDISQSKPTVLTIEQGCPNNITQANNEIYYQGDKGLANFMKDPAKTKFFDDILSSA